MRPYCTPLSKETVEAIALENVDALDASPAIISETDFVKSEIDSVFSDPTLPDVFENKRHLANCMFYRVGTPSQRVAARYNVDPEEVTSCRDQICLQISLAFYGEYIGNALESLLLPYCQTHEPKLKHWGVGSIFYWDDQWGRAFYSFWKHNIESGGDDIFCERILPYLPEKWRLSYKPKKTESVCPYLWHTMTDDEIVSVLTSMDRPIDPAKQRWGFGSFARFTDPETKNSYGKSFWDYWRTKVESREEAQFQERLLPKFPLAWQRNFDHKNFFHWRKMPYREIADVLEKAHKPHGIKKWGFGNLSRWIFEGNRSSGGLVQYWRRSVEGAGEDTIFRKEILPLLSDTLQKTYRPVGYEMTLRADDENNVRRINELDDPDSLHALADNGSLGAFQKLKRILSFHVTSTLIHLDIDMDIFDRIIERAIHMHLPFFGSIKVYTVICAKNFFQNFRGSSPLVLVGDHPVIYHRSSSGLAYNAVEHANISAIDASRKILFFRNELMKRGFAEELILRLFDLLMEGVGIDEIISSDAADQYGIDEDISKIAACLREIVQIG